MWDNKIFNVNGRGEDMLLATLELAFEQNGMKTTAAGYIIDPKKGMILLWHVDPNKGESKFPTPLNSKAVATVVEAWLASKPEVECMNWDADGDHDGDNGLGWRVYCEDWGHVAGNHYAICAVKPAYLWYGK